METGNQVLLLLLILILGSTVVYQYIRRQVLEPKRSQVLDERIAQEGWVINPVVDCTFVNDYRHFPYFDDSKCKEVRNVIRGEVNGANFIGFDYKFYKKVHGVYRRSTQIETVIIVLLPQADLPAFALVQPTLLEPAIKHFETFGTLGSYRLEGLDEAIIRQNISLQITSHLPPFNLQGVGRELVFYRTWQRSQTDMIVTEIKQCAHLAQSILIQ